MSLTRSETFGTHWADGPRGVERAVGGAVAQLDGARPELVLIFADAYDAHEVTAQAASASQGARIAGMSATGVLTDGGLQGGGCSALAIAGEDAAIGVGVASEASRNLREAGARATSEAIAGLDLVAGHAVILLFLDARSGDSGQAVDGAYEVAGCEIPLAGGGANGAEPMLYADASAQADAVVAVALGCSAQVAVATAHGCRPEGGPALVTRTSGRAVMELDGRPAESVYVETLGRLGHTLDEAEFSALAVLHPLAQPGLRGGVRLRHVTGRAPDGGLACVTPIAPNAAVWMAEQTEVTIVESAADVAEAVIGGLERPPRAALVFDCAARALALGSRSAEEVDGLVSAFGGALPLAGLYTRGEVGRTAGSKGDLNHAIVAVGFG